MFEEKGMWQQTDGLYVKYYKTDRYIYDVLEMVVHSDIPYVSVEVQEDQDVGLKYYSGEYSRDDFLNKYEKMKFEVDDYMFMLKSGEFLKISIESKSVMIGSKMKDLDINLIIRDKEKQA